jgi:hypothetical protein
LQRKKQKTTPPKFHIIILNLLHIKINIREHRRCNQKWNIQRNWQQDGEKQTKNTTQCVLYIRHELSYKQMEVKTNRTSFLCGNRNEHHNTELRT